MIRTTCLTLAVLSLLASGAFAAKIPKPTPTPKPTLKSLSAELTALQASVNSQSGTDTSIQQQITAIQSQLGQQPTAPCVTSPCPVHLSGMLAPDGEGDLTGNLTDQNGCQRSITISTFNGADIISQGDNSSHWFIYLQYADASCNQYEGEIESIMFWPLGTDNGSNRTTDTAALAAHGWYDHVDDCVVNADVGTMDVAQIPETGGWLVDMRGTQTLPDFSQTPQSPCPAS